MQRLSQAVDWIGAVLQGRDQAVTGACIDTRVLQPGQLFIALPGSRVDGHEFVRKAAALGASGALVSRPLDIDFPQLVVPDVLVALQALAAGQISIQDDKGTRWVVHAEWAHKNERFETARRDKQIAADSPSSAKQRNNVQKD